MINYFTLFGLEECFALDEVALQRHYIKAQQECHPDRMIGKADEARAAAIQMSMDVNDGYELLQDPLKRAQHLLSLKGIEVNGEHDTVKPSPALLMEVMEMREQLSGAKDERDAALIVRDVKLAMDHAIVRLEELFDEQNFAEAAEQVMRLRYLGKSLEEAYGRQYQLKVAD